MMKVTAGGLAVLALALFSVALLSSVMHEHRVALLGGHHGLSYSQLVSHPQFQQPMVGSDYSEDFPKTYFLAAPNPNAQYTWVCPGPSRLDDSHSGACPESSTGGFRCCIDAATGGAVTDEMCCPKDEKQLKQSTERPSVTSLTQRIEGVLGKIVTRLEKEAMPPPQPRPTQYLAASDAVQDLNAYFDSFSSKPEAHRAMATVQAKKDLNGFFTELGKGQLAGLASKPTKVKKQVPPKPTAHDVEELHDFARKLALKLRNQLGEKSAVSARENFEDWKLASERRSKHPGLMQQMQDEQVSQQLRAEQHGRAGVRQWDAGEHYYTDIRGPVTAEFARKYHPLRAEGLRQAGRGRIEVPEALVQH